MIARHFVRQLALAVSVLVGANVGVRGLAESSLPRQLLRRGEQTAPATDVFFGNSMMDAGLDEHSFASAWPGRRPLNLALGATDPVEHYLIFRQQKRHAGAAVYYGFLDTQLTDPPRGGWGALLNNRALSYYVDPDVAAEFYFSDSPLEAITFHLVARVPALVERGSVWAKVERIRRSLGEVGVPKTATNRFGRVEDFALLEPEAEEFARRCDRAAAEQAPLSAPVAALLREAKQQGVAVYTVEMPIPSEHRRRFHDRPEWKTYRSHLLEQVHRVGGVYVPAANWVGDEGFADSLHLSAEGSRTFSRRLALWAQEMR